MVQYRAQALRANLGATRTPGPGSGAQAQDQAQALGPEPQPVLRPGVSDNTHLPQEGVPPASSTGDTLLENTDEERVGGAQGGLVEGIPSPLPPQSPPSADQIMVQMVSTLDNNIERSQSALEHFREIYDTDTLEAEIQNMATFVRTLPRANQRALSQFQLMEVARLTSQLQKLIDGCENVLSYARRDHTNSEVDSAVLQVLRLKRRRQPEVPVTHSTPSPRETRVHPPHAGQGVGDDSFLPPYPTEWDQAMSWGDCPGQHPTGGCSDQAAGGEIGRWSTMRGRPTHTNVDHSYIETPRVAGTLPGARRLATPVRPAVPQPLGSTAGTTRAPGYHSTGRPPHAAAIFVLS